MKKWKSALLMSVLLVLSGCGNSVGSGGHIRFTRDIGDIDYSTVIFTAWDTRSASQLVSVQDIRDYTLMIYMNGSDLESENGAATADINEMLVSGVDTERVNVIIFTGGTNRWQNDIISENECALWRLNGDDIEKITGVGLLNMGDAGTLSGFIEFGLASFPAYNYGLVMWDHGGGSIAGYGHDEKFENSSLGLLEIDYAFEKAGLANARLEFLGFDACLMSTVEVAVVASRYASYLVASEDLEPGDGWDYKCLSALNAVPPPGGAAFGKAVTDAFYEYYGDYFNESVTMAVTDLSGVSRVMGAMGSLMERCSSQLTAKTSASFYALAKRRGMTKTLGNGSPRDDDCDMVDAGDMARKLSSMFPNEAAELLSALENAVVYQRHNSNINLYGLSAYYIFGGGEYAENSLETYASLSMSGAYTEYLRGFASHLSGYGGAPRPAVRSVHLNGAGTDPLLAYETYRSKTGAGYAIPAVLNGGDADIIIFCPENGGLQVLGARREDGYIVQKGLDNLEPGDTLSFYRENGDTGVWERSETVTVTSKITALENNMKNY